MLLSSSKNGLFKRSGNMGLSADAMAGFMIRGIADYVKDERPKYVRFVEVVIHDQRPELIPPFVAEVDKYKTICKYKYVYFNSLVELAITEVKRSRFNWGRHSRSDFV